MCAWKESAFAQQRQPKAQPLPAQRQVTTEATGAHKEQHPVEQSTRRHCVASQKQQDPPPPPSLEDQEHSTQEVASSSSTTTTPQKGQESCRWYLTQHPQKNTIQPAIDSCKK